MQGETYAFMELFDVAPALRERLSVLLKKPQHSHIYGLQVTI